MQYDLNLGPYGSQRIEVQGRFFKYAEGQGKIKVTLDGGRSIELVPGQGVAGEKFSGLSIVDKSGYANVGVMLAGDFDFRDDTMQAFVTGAVESLRLDEKRILEGKNFMGHWNSGGATNYFNFCNLENPANSGKNVIVNGLSCHGPQNWFDLMLAPTLTEVQAPTTVAAKYAKNLRGPSGSADLSTAILTGRYCTTQPGPMPEPMWRGYAFQGATSRIDIPIDPDEPIVVRPGFSLMLQTMATSSILQANVRFREEAAL